MKKLFPWVLILSGFILIGTAMFQRLDTLWYQNHLLRQYESHIAQLKNQDKASPHSPQTAYGTLPEQSAPLEYSGLPGILENPDQEENIPKASGKKANTMPEIIGILSIPKISLSVAMGEGADQKAMKYTVGHFPQTARPGQPGNFALVGHRSHRYGQFFNRLDQLEKGDPIIVKSGNLTFTYNVTETFIVDPEDTWVLNPTKDASITLVTCTPVRSPTHRLIVKGMLVHTK